MPLPPHTVEEAEQSFWSRVEIVESGCWEWTGKRCRKRGGYGVFKFEGRERKAHRLAWRFIHGEWPDGYEVLHLCDNPPCVNPDHTVIGTHLENMRGMIERGRGPLGRRAYGAKLYPEQVQAVRVRVAAGETQRAVAQGLGVSPALVSFICGGKRWKHL